MSTPETPSVVPFSDFITTDARGTTHDRLTADLNDLVMAVQNHGKKGTLTLTITVAPLDKAGEQVAVSSSVKVTKPERDPRKSIYFVDRTGNLVTSDPNQAVLPLTELPEPAQPKSL